MSMSDRTEGFKVEKYTNLAESSQKRTKAYYLSKPVYIAKNATDLQLSVFLACCKLSAGCNKFFAKLQHV